MANGGLMQLVAYGAQDKYLTGEPEVTFFKVAHRRHSNFATEVVEQTFNGTADFGKKVQCTVSRNGDLIHHVYLVVDLPSVDPTGGNFNWVENIGHVLVEEVAVEIGGQVIDRHYGEWLTIWNELTQTAEKAAGYDTMIGNVDALNNNSGGETTPAYTVYVPLQFWFNRNPGLALPLIALQYHEVKFNVTFRRVTDCYTLSAGSISPATPAFANANLLVEYVYLDDDERRLFAQSQHEYLIEQLQFSGDESFSNSSVKSKLLFNHPCKEFVWVLHTAARESAKDWSTFTNASGVDTIVDAKLQFNGHDRFTVQKARYFNVVQPYQCHTAVPSTGIYVYSFALNPEEHQPSGSVNMSRIDNATLLLNTTTSSNAFKLRVYAVNYNVLKLISGMGGFDVHNEVYYISFMKTRPEKYPAQVMQALTCGKQLNSCYSIPTGITVRC